MYTRSVSENIQKPIVMLATLLLIYSSWTGIRGSVSEATEQVDPLTLIFQMAEHYAKVDNYTTIFLIQERIGDKLQPESKIILKFKKPFMVYMKWLEGPKKGNEILYVDGKYNNEILVRTNKWYNALIGSLDPHGALAMDGNRHPVTEVGIGHLVNVLVTSFRQAKEQGDALIQEFSAEATMFDRPAYKIEATFPPSKYYKDAARIILYIDKEHQLPVFITIFNEANQLVEKYGYQDLQLNVGLTEKDFDKANPAYKF